MSVTICGQRAGADVVLMRTVTLAEVFAAWGPLSAAVLYATVNHPLVFDGFRVWTEDAA